MKKIIGITMIKDEIDILPATIPHMMEQLDLVVVYDNLSTDGSREYLQSLKGEKLVARQDQDEGYWQSRKMTRWAADWATQADWLIPFDADELWYSTDGVTVAEALRNVYSGVIAPAITFDFVPTALDDLSTENPVERMLWRKEDQAQLPKVACRPSLPVRIQQGNHGASYSPPSEVHGALQIRHYQYRSEDQFVKKIRNGFKAYKQTTLPEALGAHWRGFGKLLQDEGEDALREAYRAQILVDDPAEGRYVEDSFPGNSGEIALDSAEQAA